MNRNKILQRAEKCVFAMSLSAALCFGLITPSLALPAPAEPAAVPATEPAQKCLSDLRALGDQMQSGGYWLHGSGFGYGYPFYGYGYDGFGSHGYHGPASGSSHWRTRPGYEVRTLVASATILAERGQEQGCDALLIAARDIYKEYAADLHAANVPIWDGSQWRREQIAAALPVAGSKTTYRSDQLMGADVVNNQGEDIGDVYDVVISPQTGKIAYLVIGRGGVLGIGEKHVPVPWGAFKVAAGGNMMVLDTTKTNMDAAPRVAENHFSPRGNVGEQEQSVDSFWKMRVPK